MREGSSRRPLELRRRGLLCSAAGIGSAALLGRPGESRAADLRSGPGDPEIADFVRQEFLHAWNGYKKFAFGHDQVLPVSGTHQEFFVPGSPIGLSIIEALDTLYVMGLDDDLQLGLDWIYKNLNFNIDGDFHVFEVIIRVLGGLLAGFLAVGDERLLALAKDCADRLLPAFTKSPTGLPYQYVNFATGAVSGPTPPLAEVGTNILEFGVLSTLTGDPRYFNLSKQAYRVAIGQRSSLNLLATTINVETGRFVDTEDQAPNPPVDSFYEYLWGGYALFGDTECRDWYRMLNAALSKHLLETYNGMTWYKQVDYRTGALLGRSQSELASFWAELVAAGGNVGIGQSYYKSWTAVLDKYPVLPEGIDYTNLTATTPSNQFRPEYLNSSFDLFWQTGSGFYEFTAIQDFLGFVVNARVPNGYTIIDDVTTKPMTLGDLFPAYGFAENFKYIYLIFARTNRFDTSNFYLSTEGKILKGLVRA